jgi:hypothetical protein
MRGLLPACDLQLLIFGFAVNLTSGTARCLMDSINRPERELLSGRLAPLVTAMCVGEAEVRN